MEVLFADDCVVLWRREEDGIVGINECGVDKQVTIDTRGKLRWNRTYRDSLDSRTLCASPAKASHSNFRGARHACGTSINPVCRPRQASMETPKRNRPSARSSWRISLSLH